MVMKFDLEGCWWSLISRRGTVHKGHRQREKDGEMLQVLKVCVNLAILNCMGALQVCWLSRCCSCPDFIKGKYLTKRFVVS